MRPNPGTVQWNRSFLSSIIPRNNVKGVNGLRKRFIAKIVPGDKTRIQYLNIKGTTKVMEFLESRLPSDILPIYDLYKDNFGDGTFRDPGRKEDETKEVSMIKDEVVKIMATALGERGAEKPRSDSDTDTTAFAMDEEEDILGGEDLEEALQMWDWDGFQLAQSAMAL